MPRLSRRALIRFLLLVVVPLAAAGAGLAVYLAGGRYVDTDDAYVKARYAVKMAPEVAGRVTDVAVAENQRVAKGDVLFRIDPESYRLALKRARSHLASVRDDLKALKAQFRQKQTDLDQAQEDIDYYRRRYHRLKRLAGRNAASQSEVDAAEHKLARARLALKRARRALDRIRAQLGADPSLPVTKQPRFREAEARRDQAAVDLRHTVVRAPRPGVVGNLQLQAGDYVKPGNPLFALVSPGFYLKANLKETQLTHVRPGDPATVELDTYPGEVIHAEVSSIAPATGSEFSVLPAQNASGNWVEVVQRVPVRLRLEDPPEDIDLRSGLSAAVSIDTGHERSLAGLLGGSARAGQ